MMQSVLSASGIGHGLGGAAIGALLLAAHGTCSAAAAAERAPAQDALEAVVEISAQIPPDARTASSLGTDREGTGVVIDDSGLVITIGYLILEAIEVEIEGADGRPVPARIVAYDHESGFGLVRASQPLGLEPITLGNSDDIRPLQPMLAVSQVGGLDPKGVYVVDRRQFAGYWEYLLERAIFTAPPHPRFGGAALLDREGRLQGIGSLIVPDAATQGRPVPGNMFIPINDLKPIMADLLTSGRRAEPPRPWLGVHVEEHRGRVFVIRVAPDGPAEAAGLRANDLILGVGGQPVGGLADFYRTLWAEGEAGTLVPLDVLQGTEVRRTDVRSIDRYRYLRLSSSE